ncbi:protein of unknown function [Taphrina deformans PYCC 5710]|uniref:Uncharacterized protein n=1 Tax=Taphrina deformans (strain PYCC 5710 / ATCC 11124 / CBS 356.35 / IMI 108563 / JCM 9778 / NBRC 8474) TaxID=1097556 RepID=R4XD41_TAPDE|nr:protein of unknown function [Taphrina deformans PYCC 5710]|eukprot:CCG83796.1 protein of unknown function [Taphrina deformans PYCC 5710]
MGLSGASLALPSPAHIDAKASEVVITPLVGRKQSFRGFSSTSLSSLALGRGHNNSTTTTANNNNANNNNNTNKRSSANIAKKSVNFLMSGFRDHESSSDTSRPPSLMTDDGSLTTCLSSRSPSPEPSRSTSRLESAFHNYISTDSAKVLQTILLPTLSHSTSSPTVDGPPSPKPTISRRTTLSATLASSFDGYLLEESDINVLFKWWNHLLLISTPCIETFEAIYAIACHPSLRSTVFWNAHYELTLSTTLALGSTILPSLFFARLIALGYVYHPPTSLLLQNLFTDPTRVGSTEPWIKRAKNVETLVETIKHVYKLSPELDDGGVIEGRLEEMLCKVIMVTSYPNPRLNGLVRLLSGTEGVFALKLEDCLVRIASRIGIFDFVGAFFLLDVLSAIPLRQTDFWLEVLERIIVTENHVLQIRSFSFLYESWSVFSSCGQATEMLISPTRWEYFFTHWSGIVRDHYMRLVAFKLCFTNPDKIQTLLIRAFETSLQETCQLRDCLPSNPIPNKRFVIRPISNKASPYRPALRSNKVYEVGTQAHLASPATGQICNEVSVGSQPKKKLGFLRSLWSEENKDDAHPMLTAQTASKVRANVSVSEVSSDTQFAASGYESRSPRQPQVQKFKFVPEYVGKQWSLTSDDEAIRFLDSVMDIARDGRLPLHCFPLSAQTSSKLYASGMSLETVTDGEPDFVAPFELGTGRKRLWTRSLSEWSTLLDDADRFWRTCGGRSLSTSSSVRSMNCPLLEVEFPRWFVQRSTQVADDGVKEV